MQLAIPPLARVTPAKAAALRSLQLCEEKDMDSESGKTERSNPSLSSKSYYKQSYYYLGASLFATVMIIPNKIGWL